MGKAPEAGQARVTSPETKAENLPPQLRESESKGQVGEQFSTLTMKDKHLGSPKQAIWPGRGHDGDYPARRTF